MLLSTKRGLDVYDDPVTEQPTDNHPEPADTPDRPADTPDRPAETPDRPADSQTPSHSGPSDTAERKDSDARAWGRVDEEGRVFVRTADGEREVGQYPEGTPAEALAFYSKRYDALVFEVDLLEQRIKSGALAPDDATASVSTVRSEVQGAAAVGDLDALLARLDALTGLIGMKRQEKLAEKALRRQEATATKQRIVEEAEKIAAGRDWKAGADRLRALLDEWKGVPRLDKKTDDELWHRFSTARTTYTKARKAHFAELDARREESKAVKERLVKEAEALAGSTEWGPTSGRFRDLMREWKAAGPAPRGVDDKLWKRFRAAQDAFFSARDEVNAKQDKEFAANAEVKEKLLAEAEALLPVTDLDAAKQALRSIAERWEAAGKVPRDRIKGLEGRLRKVEQAVRDLEADQWRRTNPEARARAADTVAQLETSIAALEAEREKALAAGNEKKAADAAAGIEARQAWLAEARRALADFGG